MIAKLSINNCIECIHHLEYSDSYDNMDGVTIITCGISGRQLGETKTRWLMLERSYIDIPSDCPLISNDNEYDE